MPRGDETVKIMRTLGSATDFLDALMRQFTDDGGERVHQVWMGNKTVELNDPNHPFRGAPPKGSRFEKMYRTRVSDLTGEEKVALVPFQLRADPNSQRLDVYHSLYLPQEQLVTTNPESAYKNRVSVIAFLLGLAQLYKNMAVEQLEVDMQKMYALSAGDDKTPPVGDKLAQHTKRLQEAAEFRATTDKTEISRLISLNEWLYCLVHIGWAAGEVAKGVKPQDNDQIRAYDQLDDWTTEYDIDIAIALQQWVLENINQIRSKRLGLR